MWLYYWEKYGYEKAEQIFKRDYIADKGHVKNADSLFVNVLDGKLEFLKMVKGKEDTTYTALWHRFNRLIETKKELQAETIDLEAVLNTLINKGINPAMDLYFRFKNG